MRNVIPRSEDGRLDITNMGDFHDKLEQFSKEVAKRLLKDFPEVDFFDLESSFKSQFDCQYACAMMKYVKIRTKGVIDMRFKKYITTIIVLVMILSLTGCEEEIKTASQVDTYIDLVRVCHDDSEAVYYDNNTGVMYYRIFGSYGSSAMTPIYNTDGTVKIYDKWQ